MPIRSAPLWSVDILAVPFYMRPSRPPPGPFARAESELTERGVDA